MKILVCFLLFYPLFSVYAETSEADSITPNGTPNDLKRIQISKTDIKNLNTNEFHFSPRTYQTLLYDPGLTMRSGVENVLLVHHGISRAEDRTLGTRWFPEEGFLSKGGGVLVRFAKYLLLDVPIDFLCIVIAHEYFGHGSRYRELNIGPINYHFNLPTPYGSGGGYATVSNLDRRISDHEWLNIWEGGLEVHHIINWKLNLRWMARRQMHYREASLYFWAWQDKFQYIQGANEDLAAAVPDMDPEAYVRILNRHAGYLNPDSLLMDVGDFKTRNLVNLVNPFVWFALFVQLKTGLWDGNTTTGLPMIRLGELWYLPSMSMVMTPFGPEYHLENYLQTKNLISLLDVRIGDQTFYKDWWGVGIHVHNIYGNKRFSLDVNFDTWNQPELEFDGSSITSKGGGLGAAFSLRVYYDFTGLQYPISVVGELGYKSTGFLEGYVLDSSPIIMFGLGIRN